MAVGVSPGSAVIASSSLGLACLGGYILISMLFLKYPSLLHQRKRTKFNCTHISHRGGSFERLENTMEAFEHAVRYCGTDMIELDVQLTFDKQVVVAHDDSLLRLTGVDQKISQLCYKDLPLLQPTIDVEFLNGLHSSPPRGPIDRRIPLLREVFERYPTIPIHIDIKQDNDDLTALVHDLITKFNRKEITVWGNMSYIITQKCYEKDPEVPIFFSASRVLWLVFLAWTGLLPFFPIKETCLTIFHPTAQENNPRFRKAAACNPSYWFFLRMVDLLVMKPFIFDHLRRRGLQVYLWVINDRRTFDRCFELGATGVMTDCPSLLRTYLQENPHIAFSARQYGPAISSSSDAKDSP